MSVSALDYRRLATARQQLAHCNLCSHRCGADRIAGEVGPCKAGTEARVFRHRVEYGEELELVPSHLFYVSGCDIRCAFCIAQSHAFNPRSGTLLTGEFLARAVQWGTAQGAQNVQWVGGEPTIHIPAILAAMAHCDALPKIVWKSDFHGSPEAFDLLRGVVDVYVADFKFGNDLCAKRIARVDPYVRIITHNLIAASSQADLIVRHLLLPGHFDCCFRPIVDWMHNHLPLAKFSIRDGYLPRWQAHQFQELARPLDRQTAGKARALAAERGLHINQ